MGALRTMVVGVDLGSFSHAALRLTQSAEMTRRPLQIPPLIAVADRSRDSRSQYVPKDTRVAVTCVADLSGTNGAHTVHY